MARTGLAALGIRQSLSGYRLETSVTHTRLGLVYRGRDRQRRRVLVKVLPALGGGRVAASLIASELQRIAAMRHPNIVPIEQWGDINGVPFVITPDEPPLSLAERLTTSRVDRKTAVSVLRGVAGAIDYVHAMGLHHGGLEPAVVKVSPDGTLLVADFGLARLAGASQVSGRSAVSFGSAAYVAPEQVLGGLVGPAADVYAFAAIGYDLLTGTAPFDEPGTSARDQLDAHLRRQPAPPSTRDPSLPAQVDDVLLVGLAKDPAERWSSCGAMVRALERALPAASGARPGGRAGAVLRLAGAVGLPLVIGALVLTHPALLTMSTTKLAGIAGVPRSAAPQVSSSQSKAVESLPSGLVPRVVSPPVVPPTFASPSGGGPATTPTLGPLSIKLSTQTPSRGDALTVSGTGFDPNGSFAVTLEQPGAAYQLQPPVRVVAGGRFSVRVFIPGQATPGPATISACAIAADGHTEGCTQLQISVAAS
ncbi:MAG TPA: serine/threonine-protein kinase [Candidatus Dormibacteraeota bacterium]|nr:serine/threonine-protein kinase [Candidatus Dormibacteraeota bacterium]